MSRDEHPSVLRTLGWLLLGLVFWALVLLGGWFAITGESIKAAIALGLVGGIYLVLVVAEWLGYMPGQEAEREKYREEPKRKPGESLTRYILRMLLRNFP